MLSWSTFRTPLRLWGLGGLTCAAIASTALAPSADGDIWWHLAAGREMVARGAFLSTDPFSLSASGRAWTDVHWLFQLGAYAVHHYLGLAGLVAVKCALLGFGAWLLLSWVIRDRFGRWAAPALATWLLAALFVARALLLLRPVLITLVCAAFFLRQLELFGRDRRPRHLVWLVLAQVVWANCQGLSALGPAMVGAYLLPTLLQRARSWPLLGAELGCLLASLCTPYGWHGLALSQRLFERLLPSDNNVYAQAIAENVPPFVLERWTGGELWHFKWYGLCLGVALVAGGRRLRPSHALLLAGFGALALLANRNVLLFYWVSAPIAALHLAPGARRLMRRLRSGPRWLPTLNAAAFTVVFALSSLAAARETPLSAPSPFRAPSESADRLARLPAASVFCADNQGGYLIWRLFPRQRPYIDTRLVLRSADEYAEYLGVVDFPERFAAFQRRHHFGYVLLPVAYPDRYLGLIAELYRSSDFKLVFTNGSEVLFARRDLVTTPEVDLGDEAAIATLERELGQRWSGHGKLTEAAQLHLATLLLTVGEVDAAERSSRRIATPAALALLARLHYARGDFSVATSLSQNLSDDASGRLTLLSRLALAQGDTTRGARYLRRALQTNPFDAEASQLLSTLEANEP